MGDLSENFNRSEFACKGVGCGCRHIAVDAELINVLEWLRQKLKQPITVTSGYRCTVHNAKVGGSPRSMHLTGKAVDIQVKDTSPATVQKLLKETYPSSYGIGSYETFTHIDVRDEVARWG